MKNKSIITGTILFSLLILNLLLGCSRIYYATIENNTDQIVTIITTGDSLFSNQNMKLISTVDNTYFYEMNPKSDYLLRENINNPISPENFPYSSMSIILEEDTTFLNGPNEIFEHMEKCKNDRVLKIE